MATLVVHFWFMAYNYKKYTVYISSNKWLVKKSKLVIRYIKMGWPIWCIECGSEHNLTVHHLTYERLFKERLTDLVFLCWTCHKWITRLDNVEKNILNTDYKKRPKKGLSRKDEIDIEEIFNLKNHG